VLTCRRLPPASLPEGTSHDSLGESPSGGEGFEGDLVAEGLELGEGSLASAVGVAADEVIAAQVGIVTVVGEQMLGDHQDGVAHGHGRKPSRVGDITSRLQVCVLEFSSGLAPFHSVPMAPVRASWQGLGQGS
jgi:hypothetical protein